MKFWLSLILSAIYLSTLPFALYADSPSALQSTDIQSTTPNKSMFTANELKWLEKQQAIPYVYDPDWAPFEWKNEIDNHTGIIADIMNLIHKRTGMRLMPVHTDTWDESVALVKNGEVGMFSAITQNAEREQYLNFTTRDIYTYPAVLITKFSDKTVYINVAEDFEGRKIGVVKSSGLGQYIKDTYPDFEYVDLASTEEGFYAIRNNKIDSFAINTVTAKYYIEKKGFSDLKLAIKLDYLYHLKIAIRKDMPKEILSILDKSLSSIDEHELNEIFNKWTEVSRKQWTDWNLLFQISGILTIVILFLFWSNRRLNSKVKDRTRELTDTNIQLQKSLEETQHANNAKSLFLANVSHEIRTPMNGVLSMLQVLRNTELSEEQKLYIETLDCSSNLLLTLIDDVLDLSKIESGKMLLDPKPFSSFSWINDIQNLIEPLFDNKKTIFTTEIADEIPPFLEGDSQRLLQIVVNLLNNAAKSTPEGEVKLIIDGESVKDNQFKLDISVKDTGIGIPADKLEHIFEAFHQLSTNSSITGGVGLGLAICKRLTDIMNGSLQVSSSPGKGTCFTFTVTLPIAEEESLLTDTIETYALNRKLSVLIVDDNSINRFAARKLLEQAGQTITEAENGQDAIELLNSAHFDVILMDIHMPIMDGVTATSKIREGNSEFSQIPIIGVTASVMKDEQDRYIKAGMSAVVAKPIVLKELMKVIQEIT